MAWAISSLCKLFMRINSCVTHSYAHTHSSANKGQERLVTSSTAHRQTLTEQQTAAMKLDGKMDGE